MPDEETKNEVIENAEVAAEATSDLADSEKKLADETKEEANEMADAAAKAE